MSAGGAEHAIRAAFTAAASSRTRHFLLQSRHYVDIRGASGGELRIAAGGTLALGAKPNAKFRATDSGTIEGQAGANLTAQGKFEAGPAGCIGLSAGGTLDTSLASFDVALSGSCP